MLKTKTSTLIIGVSILLLIIYTAVNRGRELLGYLTYSLVNLRVHTMGLMSTTLKATVGIENPSSTSVKIDSLKVEIYYLDKDNNSRSLLATSPVTTLSIAQKSKLNKEFTFDVSNLTLLNFFGNAYKTGHSQAMNQRMLIVVKSTVAGQYIEKEFVYQ